VLFSVEDTLTMVYNDEEEKILINFLFSFQDKFSFFF
jgi:hypothetical protein